MLSEAKQRARQHWAKDPCGAVYAREHEFGTREFFDAVEKYRYTEYAPWMPSVMGFDQVAGARLLEVGCGMGTDLLQFARGGAHVTGVDLVPRSLEITRHRFQIYGERGDFLVADAERLPFADDSFDVVYSNGVLHHTPGTDCAVGEIHRVLRRGGTAKVMLYHRDSLAYWGGLMLGRGVLKGEFLRGRSVAELLSRQAEYSEGDGQPLVKVFSRRQARALFKPFQEVKLEVEQLTRPELRFLSPLVSDNLFGRLRSKFGWNVIITGRK